MRTDSIDQDAILCAGRNFHRKSTRARTSTMVMAHSLENTEELIESKAPARSVFACSRLAPSEPLLELSPQLSPELAVVPSAPPGIGGAACFAQRTSGVVLQKRERSEPPLISAKRSL